MNIDQDDDHDDGNGNGHDHAPPAADPVLIAFTLIDLALNPKAAKAGLKQLVKLDKDIAIAEEKFVNLQSQAAAIETALTARAAAIDAREAAITKREDEFTAAIEEARDHLRGFYNSIAEADRHLRYRILSHADLLHGYNSQLQDLPDWQQIKNLVPNLPADLPPFEREPASHPRIDSLSDTFSDPNADRHGNIFLGTLSRDVSHKGAA
jgi:hypothetical protein